MAKKRGIDKVHSFKEMWEDEKKRKLFDHKLKLSIDKDLDKNIEIRVMENKMTMYKNAIIEFHEMPKERNAYYI